MSVLAAQARPALQSMQPPYDFPTQPLHASRSTLYDRSRFPSFREHVQQNRYLSVPTPSTALSTGTFTTPLSSNHRYDNRNGLSARPEDCLRRKTPNGTITDGYNGTIAESDEIRAHASKHMLVPTPTRLTEHGRQMLSSPTAQQWPAQIKVPRVYQQSKSLNNTIPGWSHGQAQVDSMIGMNPAPYSPMDWQYTSPRVVQPPPQSGYGPTVSDENGLYGAYWPNGDYAPYRPAAFTDYRYSNFQRELPGSGQGFGNENLANQDLLSAYAVNDGTFPPIYSRNDSSMHAFHAGTNGVAKPVHYSSSRPSNAYPAQVRSLSVANLSSPHNMSDTSNPWHTRSSLHATTPFSLEAGSTGVLPTTPQQSASELFAWATKVYKNLLSAQQESRRNNAEKSLRESNAGESAMPSNGTRLYQSLNSRNHASISQIRHGAFNHVPNSPVHQLPAPDAWSDGNIANRMVSGTSQSIFSQLSNLRRDAYTAANALNELCSQGSRDWIEGMLLNGCLSYALGEHHNAIQWYERILQLCPNHVEAMSNIAGAYFALNRRVEAEDYWQRAVRLCPTYFEAVEQLLTILCHDKRHSDAIHIIDQVQAVLERKAKQDYIAPQSLRYANRGRDNGRMMALIHAKGNLMYNMQDQLGAAKAFEEVVLIAMGCPTGGIDSLINHVLSKLTAFNPPTSAEGSRREFLLLPPDQALNTAKLCFPPSGNLPGLDLVESPASRRAATLVTSNSLLSLAKIFQDAMSPSAPFGFKSSYGIQQILALYYLSLSLQPSPSTANNVGILLAGIQPANPQKGQKQDTNSQIPGVAQGSGVALALTYYHYGLSLDKNHAHLYTNFGSLLKDIGQLPYAVRMYEKAVACDPKFDIALANLANAVKDQGRVADAITFYRRAVLVNPKFAEAVCGLANALNSICEWSGRGGVKLLNGLFDQWYVGEDNEVYASSTTNPPGIGWIYRVVEIVNSQLNDGKNWGRGILQDAYISDISQQLGAVQRRRPHKQTLNIEMNSHAIKRLLQALKDQDFEGAWILWLIERGTRMIGWQWYQDKYIAKKELDVAAYRRPRLPEGLTMMTAPTVLPFHTFTLPMTAKQVRQISQRNGMRVSCATLRSSWLPRTVFPPPPPPSPTLKIGYVSSDFNNHPLAHLMQSVFGMHDTGRFTAYCYATSASDGSTHRQQIEREAPCFIDASSWPVERLVKQIVEDGIHILINLNGYTRGARNEIFAARPAPIQMSFMGFAGSLGAEWCDYLLADETAVPQSALRPYRNNIDIADLISSENAGGTSEWVYPENIVYTRHAFFCCDHRQSACTDPLAEQQLTWSSELSRRWRMRRELFPELSPDTVIFANFNQLYKIDPTTFRTWLRILSQVPNSILWLLRFPADGAVNLLKTANKWGGSAVAARIHFTDVAPKGQHIARACVADLFLDTSECNAHTTAADCLWSGTPLLTLPRYEWKMCSRMAAGIVSGAFDLDTAAGKQARNQLVAEDEDDYERKAIALAKGLKYQFDERYEIPRAQGRLVQLREMLWKSRWTSKLFDTQRWVKDLELAYAEVWKRWVHGEGGDIWIADLAKA